MKSNISLVMASYNGQERIVRQMETIRNQTLAPDEVLIADDCSTDQTADTICQYLAQHELPGWNFTSNEKNMGWRANFAQLILKATGDYLFLCDQDDVWHPDKIARMVQILEKHPSIMLLCTNANVVYETEQAKPARLRGYGKKRLAEIPFSAAHLNVGRPGCTFCMRTAAAQNCIQKYWMPQIAHDAMLWQYAVLCDGLYLLQENMIDFVRFGANASANGSRTKEFRIEELTREKTRVQAAKAIANNEPIARKKEKLAEIQSVEKFLDIRTAFLQQPDLRKWLLLLKNIRCYHSYRNWISDLYCALMT